MKRRIVLLSAALLFVRMVHAQETGYPAMSPKPTADWTVLAYFGGDNDLEQSAITDFDELERGGGSTDRVRVIALLDRSDGNDTSNGDWTDTRLFEVGPDKSKDAATAETPTIDTEPLADLGELDTSSGQTLADFLTWGIQTYPAKHYIIEINDHGGAWTGMVSDEATGPNAFMSLPAMRDAFQAAQDAVGGQKLDLLLNDACLMSGIEYGNMAAGYFDYAVGSPEVQMSPGFDLALLLETLNTNPSVDPAALGRKLVDKYMADMQSDSSYPVLGAAVLDLRKFGTITQAVDNFAEVFNRNPAAYAAMFGKARANVYIYSFFMPEDQYGPPTNIDLGDFMTEVENRTKDPALTAAASQVTAALKDALIYGKAGNHLEPYTSYYNIYFPMKESDADGNYIDQAALPDWSTLLMNYFRDIDVDQHIDMPIGAPQVRITNSYPDVAGVLAPASIGMEVTSHAIAYGDFTVDQVQPDGSSIRLDKSRILTTIVRDGVAQQENVWQPGVDESNFTWETTLTTVSDGKTETLELVETHEGVISLAGRYQYPGESGWKDVTVLFNSDGKTENVISGDKALANITLKPGGAFEAYRSVVQPDGTVKNEPGTRYTWPKGGLTWRETPAPSGKYHLGFLVTAPDGKTGFADTTVQVSNDTASADLRGFTSLEGGFTLLRPAGWTDMDYFPNSHFWQAVNTDTTQYLVVYQVDGGENPRAVAEAFAKAQNLTIGNTKTTTFGGQNALEFTFDYTDSQNMQFTARAFAVYHNGGGLVFSAEATGEQDAQSLADLLASGVSFFDGKAVNARDTGIWESDSFDIADYPVLKDWLPGEQGELFWVYQDQKSPDTLAGVTVLKPDTDDAPTIVNALLKQAIESKPEYHLLGTDTYYGENNTWALAAFTHQNESGAAITGRLYVTVKDGTPYVLWFEAPTDTFDQTMQDTFAVMLDGFMVKAKETK
jgi:hypothetical protein